MERPERRGSTGRLGELARGRGWRRSVGQGVCEKPGGKKELGEFKGPARILVWPEWTTQEIPPNVRGQDHGGGPCLFSTLARSELSVPSSPQRSERSLEDGTGIVLLLSVSPAVSSIKPNSFAFPETLC